MVSSGGPAEALCPQGTPGYLGDENDRKAGRSRWFVSEPGSSGLLE